MRGKTYLVEYKTIERRDIIIHQNCKKLARKGISRIVAVVAIIVIVIIAGVGVYYLTLPPPTPTPTIKNPDTLIIALTEEPKTLDPAAGSAGWLDNNLMMQFYDRLVTWNDSELVPMLAESWTVSPDSKTFTFKIREGVKFTNGDPLDAYAVKYSIDRVLTMGFAPNLRKMLTPNMTKVVDATTFQIVLPKPNAPLLSLLGFSEACILDPKVVEEHGGVVPGQLNEWVASNVVGSGAYKLKEWTHGVGIVLERNGDYWRGPARIKYVKYKRILEPATSIMMLKNGDIDVIFNVAAPLVPQLLGDPNILVVPTSVTTYMWVVLDTSIPPLNDKRVRQALAYAIDYDEMISIVWHGYAKLMHGVLPEGLLGYDETLPTCQENITKAKELLAEAGYPDGFTLDAVFRPEAARRSVAELLIGYFAKIGVTLNLLEVEAPLVWSMIAEHKAPVAPMAWYAAYPDPDFIITQYYAGGGLAYYSNPEVDELIELSRTETNLTERTKIYRDIQLIVFEDMPYINIAQTPFIYAQRTWVTDYNYNPAIGWYFNCYDYKKG